MVEIFNAFEDKLKNPVDWVSRADLRVFLGMQGSKDKFNDFIKMIEKLEDSYLYVQGTLSTNKTYNKVRIYNYINYLNRVKERGA